MTLRGHLTIAACAAFTADTAGMVKLWDVASHSQRLSLTTGVLDIRGIEFSRTGDQAVITIQA